LIPFSQPIFFIFHNPMKILEIAFSCYPVTDMARARTFYEGLLGLKATMDEKTESVHWVEYDIGAGTLAIGLAPGMKPSSDGCSVSLEVEDFDLAVAELKTAGVPVQFGPLETPVCHMIYVSDPDGNSVCIHKRKPGHH
jgi:predicted enzyme related to lactoylglutathione lyase